MQHALDTQAEELRKELGEIELGVVTEGYTLATALREAAEKAGIEQNFTTWQNQDASMVCALSAVYIAARARKLV